MATGVSLRGKVNRAIGERRYRSQRTLPLLSLVMAILAGNVARAQEGSTSLPLSVIDTSPISADYFGLHIHRALATGGERRSVWPGIDGWSWRLWDARVAWKDLEPRRGDYDFSRLDALCDLARAHHVHLLLTLGLTPTWASSRPVEPSSYEPGNQAPPASAEDWRRYVDTVAKRYRGRIEAYELWNEPNVRGFFSGTPKQLVELARIAFAVIKAADPGAVVVTPSASGVPGGSAWLRAYLTAGGGDFSDVVGFHFYVTPRAPEDMLSEIATVRSVLATTRLDSAPIWNTETGWFLQNHDVPVYPNGGLGTFASRVLSDTTGAAYVARALLVGRCGSLARFYWYAWDNRRMGLLDADGQHLKVEAAALDTVRSWLLGARVVSCRTSRDGVWTVSLRRGDSEQLVVWSTIGPTPYMPVNISRCSVRRLLPQRRVPRSARRFAIVVDSLPALVSCGVRSSSH